MEFCERIEATLRTVLDRASGNGCPPQLAAALNYAVFPGGARVRPRLCLAVAKACGDADPLLADAAACAIELIHCASLVHDDLPCFDDADLRRGKPTVHKEFGEAIAVLAGDALIVASFELIDERMRQALEPAPGLLSTLAWAVGSARGIISGQAWECEPKVALSDYHRAKTGGLFAAATAMGATAAGQRRQDWQVLGDKLGEAYQVADDICDLVASPSDLGKPAGRDSHLNRPNAAGELGVAGAVARLKTLLAEALDSVPPCAGADELRSYITSSARPYLPKEISKVAA